MLSATWWHMDRGWRDIGFLAVSSMSAWHVVYGVIMKQWFLLLDAVPELISWAFPVDWAQPTPRFMPVFWPFTISFSEYEQWISVSK